MYLQILKFSYTVLPRVLIRNLFKLIELFHIKKFIDHNPMRVKL